MGTWGTGNFENDFAMDWLSELQSRNDLISILVAFSKIDEGDYLEVYDCSDALAAAEVVAALRGNPSDDLPDQISSWISSSKLSANNKLVGNAKKTISQIKQSSELKNLWKESDNLAEWENVIDDLISRLQSANAFTLSFNEWTRKKWATIIALSGLGAGFAELLISSRYSIMIGLTVAWVISYAMYSVQKSK